MRVCKVKVYIEHVEMLIIKNYVSSNRRLIPPAASVPEDWLFVMLPLAGFIEGGALERVLDNLVKRELLFRSAFRTGTGGPLVPEASRRLEATKL